MQIALRASSGHHPVSGRSAIQSLLRGRCLGEFGALLRLALSFDSGPPKN